MNNTIVVSAMLATLGLGALGIYYVTPSAEVGEETPRTTREVALTCGAEMGAYHIHPTLAVTVDGEGIEVPSNIGVRPTCMTALHTHTGDGLIHVESPEVREFTLGDFFAVWNQPLNKTQLSDYATESSHTMEILVNDVIVGTGEATVLNDGDHIQVMYRKK